MNRRTFLVASVAVAAMPFTPHSRPTTHAVAEAQQAGNTRRLGILHVVSERSYLSWAFINELRDQGWVEGQNLIVEERFLRSDTEGVPDSALLARELLERRVDVLATFGVTAVRILKQLTSEVPITFSYLNDPVGIGVAASLARPGGNVTG